MIEMFEDDDNILNNVDDEVIKRLVKLFVIASQDNDDPVFKSVKSEGIFDEEFVRRWQ